MAKIFERKTTSLTISEFYDNYISGKYRFNVTYQRNSGVWSDDKRSFLIDSILKNYPVPAIFLRPCVDNESGKTIYDVVDGKQRLEAIVAFIENKIPLTTYFSEDIFIDDANMAAASEIAGLTFNEIKAKNKDFPDYIKQFWTYALNIEYLYEQKEELVASVFDRLNRNGEPLTRQELRNAKHSESELLAILRELAANEFWEEKLIRVKSVRMEDIEFISELFFVVVENKINDSLPDILDSLYDRYSNDHDTITTAKIEFLEIIDYLKAMNINYSANKRLCWTTHLYSLFTLARELRKQGYQPTDYTEQVNQFYTQYFIRGATHQGCLQKYKDASSSRTRSEIQRKNRLAAIMEYCGLSISE